VWIAWLVAVSVVFAMVCGPADRTTFAGECSNDGEGVSDPPWYFQSGVREQAVEAEANAYAARCPVQDKSQEQTAPSEGPWSSESADVE